MREPETNGGTDPAQAWALMALTWILKDEVRAERLLALTGLTPGDLRERATDPALLEAVLGYLESHEPDLIACATAIEVAPIELVAARHRLTR